MIKNKSMMTRKGYEKSLQKKRELEQRLEEAGQRAGGAAGDDCDWHDNPAYEQAVLEMQALAYRLSEINAKLTDVVFIEEKKSTQTVEIGSYATLEIEEEREVYFIGGEVDSDPSAGIISFKSPLAQAILGHRDGETVEFRTPAALLTVKILRLGKEE